MIQFTTGNILESDSEALVNTVNTVGVMGKGIALTFKKSFPNVFEEYSKEVKNGTFRVGKVQVVETYQIAPKYVVNFPTKKHWRHPSKLEYVNEGLKDLVKKIREYNISSISIPPLGCGNGKLDWKNVKTLMLESLEPISKEVEVIIFEPGYSDQKMVQKDRVDLTPSRAMLLYLLNEYQTLGYAINLLVAQKLAYFLQLQGEPLNLDFEKGFYGPYAHRLLHLLKYLNGYFIWFNEEDNKPGTTVSIDQKNFQEVQEYIQNRTTAEQKERIRKVLQLIEGFESPYGLELLATVDFLMRNSEAKTVEQVQNEIYHWTKRKKNLMKLFHIEVATKQVMQFASV